MQQATTWTMLGKFCDNLGCVLSGTYWPFQWCSAWYMSWCLKGPASTWHLTLQWWWVMHIILLCTSKYKFNTAFEFKNVERVYIHDVFTKKNCYFYLIVCRNTGFLNVFMALIPWECTHTQKKVHHCLCSSQFILQVLNGLLPVCSCAVPRLFCCFKQKFSISAWGPNGTHLASYEFCFPIRGP